MCRTGCKTKDHSTYGECCRAAAPRVAYCNSVNGYDATKQKRWDSELQAFRDAVAEGLNPPGTTMPKIDAAKRLADITGAADVSASGYIRDTD